MNVYHWLRRLIQQRKIAQKRKEMYPNGPQWRQIYPGVFCDRYYGIRKYLQMRRIRESKRYYRNVLGLSEGKIREIYKEPATR